MLPTRAFSELRFLVRICLGVAFLLGSLFPMYVPQRAFSIESPDHYLVSDQFLLVEEGFVMKTASISETGHRLAYSKGILHEVRENENLNSIADFYDISIDTIRWANAMEKDLLHPGDTLLILPVDGVLHTVRRGQSLLKIAQLYDVEVRTIINQNKLSDERIYAGQQIIVPGGSPLLEGVIVATEEHAPRSGIEPAPPRPTSAPDATPPTSFGILQKPCDCTYTQSYHPGHYAVDMARNGGGPIFAAEDGIVIRADMGWNGGYGNVIEIDHGNGLVTLYAHNKALHVREGNAVRRGDVIASMGNTGRVYGPTGVHVHFEVILNGVKKNPLLYLQ